MGDHLEEVLFRVDHLRQVVETEAHARRHIRVRLVFVLAIAAGQGECTTTVYQPPEVTELKDTDQAMVTHDLYKDSLSLG